MFDVSTLAIFSAAVLVLLVTPGPAVLYIVARSIDQGRRAGVVSVLGVGVGTLFHVLAAALGVSAILVKSVVAFNIVKYLGAAYLIYLGVRKLFGHGEAPKAAGTTPQTSRSIFYQGIVVNILNPKTALFIFAFIPQFVDVTRGAVAIQILVLGGILVGLGTLSDGLYAILAGSMGNWLRGSTRFLRIQRYLSGGIFIALGATALFSGPGKK